MDFTEAEQRRTMLSDQMARGQITREAFIASINALRVTDSAGRTWQPAPSPAGWLWWNGTAWQPATPPVFAGSAGPGSQPARPKDFNEFKSSLMTMDEFRKVSKEVPLAKRPQKWWDLLSVLGGCVAAVLWFLYGSVRSGQEGFDLITPLLMIAIPVFLLWFRQDIDQMLMPLQPHRKKHSKILLIGLGMATPFLTAWILYNIFHFSQYPLMQTNIVVGTLAAYAITRDPQIHTAVKIPPVAGSVLALIIFSAIFASLMITPVMADDCARDPLNAQDCLRTSGYAEGMAGLAATILQILVNGPIIAQTLVSGGSGIQPPSPTGPPTTPQPPAQPQAPVTPPAEPPVPAAPVEPPKPTEDDLRKIAEAAAKQKAEIAAAAAAAKEKAAAAAAAAAQAKADAAAAAAAELKAKGIDPVTGKRILTPEQIARKAQIQKEMAANMAEAEAWNDYANKLENAVTVLEGVEKAADIAIDVGATLSPGAGAKIKNIYGATKTIAKNMSQSYADGKSMVDGLKDGVIEAATDKALDAFAGKVTDKFKGKVPGFGKFDSHTTDYGNMSMGQIKERLGSGFVKETGDIGQDLRHIIQQGDAKRAVGNAAKNAVQGQVQGATLWDPFKKFFGVSK